MVARIRGPRVCFAAVARGSLSLTKPEAKSFSRMQQPIA